MVTLAKLVLKMSSMHNCIAAPAYQKPICILQLSEAAQEARDNVKYLSTLDQVLAPLQAATLPELLAALPALFSALHTLQNTSR